MYRNWMKNAFESSQTVPRRPISAQALFSIFMSLLKDIPFSTHVRRESSLLSGIEDTSPVVFMLSELRKQTAASTALTIDEVMVSYLTFMTPHNQGLLSSAMQHVNLTDKGCHPISNAAIAAAMASEHDCPLPPPNLEDGLSYAKQDGAYRILYIDSVTAYSQLNYGIPGMLELKIRRTGSLKY